MQDTPIKGTINDVSDTSFWVAYYRAKENERPDAIFKDPFAKKLVGERGKDIAESMPAISRYAEWTVVSRTVMIDRMIEKSIADGVEAVINLGAGLDARPYRMNLPASLLWIEVDYPNIIKHKTEILKSDSPKCKLQRFEVDLANDQKRREFLKNIVPESKKVLIITEGVIPYLDLNQVSRLGQDLLDQKRFVFWIIEYFNPRVYQYLKNTVRAVKMKNAPFKFYPPDWFEFFKNVGWVAKDLRFSVDIATEFKRKLPMPMIGKIIFLFMSQQKREKASRMAGYVLMERA